jgi:phosphatidylglycerol:prolipoprotein diacylglycerol transferase
MLSTLFHIPMRITLGETSLPLAGFGILMFLWAIVAVVMVTRTATTHGWRAALETLGLPLALTAAAILWLLPILDDGTGVPVRGYGAMLLAAAAAGVWLSIVRGRRMGFDADTILALGMEVFLWGIVGARLFYVIEYHDQFFAAGRSWTESLAAVLNGAAGGLVVFGSVPTAALAAWRFASRRGLSLPRLADCIAPGLLLGLAIGRIGCFLNGCCYGGPCDLPWAVQFPPGSPPWLDQEARGLLPAVATGGGMPWSLPVHPAQLYAAIDAAILAMLVCLASGTPLARRDGQVFALVLTLHPISRLLLEAIRVDEPPALGTPLSISQLVSLASPLLNGTIQFVVPAVLFYAYAALEKSPTLPMLGLKAATQTWRYIALALTIVTCALIAATYALTGAAAEKAAMSGDDYGLAGPAPAPSAAQAAR